MKHIRSQSVFRHTCLLTGCVTMALAGLLIYRSFMVVLSHKVVFRNEQGKTLLISNQSPDFQKQLLQQARNWFASNEKADPNRALQTISQGLYDRGIKLDARQWEAYFPGTACRLESNRESRLNIDTADNEELLQWRNALPSDAGLNDAVAFLSSLDSACGQTDGGCEYLVCFPAANSAWQKNPLDRVCLLTPQQIESLTAGNIRTSLIPSGILFVLGCLQLVLSLGGFAPNAFVFLFVHEQERQWILYLERLKQCLFGFCLILLTEKKVRFCSNASDTLSDNILGELGTVRLLF